jgi:ACT domain-containing protein
MEKEYMYNLDKCRELLGKEQPADVVKATGLSRHTVYRVRDGVIDNVNYDTVKSLSDYFMQAE